MATLLLTFSGKLLSLKRVLNANTVSNWPINKQVKNLHLFVFCTKKKNCEVGSPYSYTFQ